MKINDYTRGFLLCACMLALTNGLQAQPETPVARTDASEPLRTLANQAFRVGEYLEFNVHFGKLSAGRGAMSIPEIRIYNDRPSYLLVSRLWTNDFFSSIYRVDDYMECLLDTAGIFPWRYERKLHEGKFRAYRKAVFDPLNARAFEGKDTLAVPPYSQDVLSILYYVRTLDLQVGQKIDVDNYIDKKNYPLRMNVVKKEKIKVPAGKFECFLLEPGKRPGADFEKKGDMWIWVSTDSRRLPVKVKTKAPLGSVIMELAKIRVIKTAD